MPISSNFVARSTHLDLGDAFFDSVEPASFPKKIIRYRNESAAKTIGLEGLTDEEWVTYFAHFQPLPGSLPEPLALRYHGHQFRTYNPQLGDGRGFLYAQMEEIGTKRLLDLGTKGSGQTPWSRNGDGRLTLKGGIREVLATEMLEALGVNTSKTLSIIETGEPLYRGDEPSPTRSSVMVRLNHSHIRFGSFQRFYSMQDYRSIEKLADHTIRHYYPELGSIQGNEKFGALLSAVSQQIAQTTAGWMLAGFVHGVLNTDNMNITGESFDYGPWCFLETLDVNCTAAYFDQTGLYAYGRQPDSILWNLAQLATCFTPFTSHDDLSAILDQFAEHYHQAFRAQLLWRLGLKAQSDDENAALTRAAWLFLSESQMPFEAFFFDWFGGAEAKDTALKSSRKAHYQGERFAAFISFLDHFEPRATKMRDHAYFANHPPCTMQRPDVEALWEPIAQSDNWEAFEQKRMHISLMREALHQS